MICGIELELDEVAHFCLDNVRLEGVTALRFTVSLCLIATHLSNEDMFPSRTFATATVRVIGSLVEVDAAELEGAGAEVTL